MECQNSEVRRRQTSTMAYSSQKKRGLVRGRNVSESGCDHHDDHDCDQGIYPDEGIYPFFLATLQPVLESPSSNLCYLSLCCL